MLWHVAVKLCSGNPANSAALAAMPSHSSRGYSHSWAVGKDQPLFHRTVHDRWSREPSHSVLRVRNWGTFVRTEVHLFRLEPHMQFWKGTENTLWVFAKSFMRGRSQSMELVGFSMENPTCSEMQR